jgi:LysR family transcriptional regulator, nitrogen assimilation regulatory protein
MDLKQLEYFVCVAELGSFTRASILLNVAQPALSRQVRLLEVELRQHLLIRHGRGVTMTEAGSLLLSHGRGILRQVERAREELGRIGGALAGRVTLGLPPSIARLMTVSLIRECHNRLPNAIVSITEGLSISIREALMRGRLDIALLYNPTPDKDMEITPLLEEDLFLIAPRSAQGSTSRLFEPISLRDVAKLPLIIPSLPNALRMLVETQMAFIGVKPNIAFEIDGVAAILELVADVAGHAILPKHAVATSGKADNFVVRPIIEPRITSLLAIAISAHRPATDTQKAVIALIPEVVGSVINNISQPADPALM